MSINMKYRRNKKVTKYIIEVDNTKDVTDMNLDFAEVGALYEKLGKNESKFWTGNFTLDGETKYFVKLVINANRRENKNDPNFYLYQSVRLGNEYKPDEKIGSFWYCHDVAGLLTGSVKLSGTTFHVNLLFRETFKDNIPQVKILWELEKDIEAPKESEIERKKIPQNNQDEEIPY